MSEEKKIVFLDKMLNKDELLGTLDPTTFKRIKKIKLKEVVVEGEGKESLRPFFVSDEMFKKLLDSKDGEKFQIKEIILEDQTDIIEAMQKLRETYSKEIAGVVQRLNRQYEIEVERISNGLRYLSGVKDFIATNGLDEFSIENENKSVWLIKTFKEPVVVSDGYSEGVTSDSGYKRTRHIFNEPICKIQKIALNILHRKIIDSSIKLLIDGAHPNVNRRPGSITGTRGTTDENNLTNPCAGNLIGRDIDISDPKRVLHLIDEITKTYSHVHLDSTFWHPVREGWNGKQWQITEEKDISEKIWK